MRKKNGFLRLTEKMFLFMMLSVFIVVGCSDDDDDDDKNSLKKGSGQEIVVDASSKTDWVYFSLSEGKVVSVDGPESSDDWDMGFRRYHFRLNCGASGEGKGGALDMGALDWSEVKAAPASGYVVDEEMTFSTHGGEDTVSVNPELEKWGTMDLSSMPPVFKPSNHIFVVKTAKGKYAKVWLKSYYNDEAASGYITMKYYYQPNESTDLDDGAERQDFVGLDAPYLICAGRNPGGVGFDFHYYGKTGGAKNLDECPTLEYDLKIKTIKSEKNDGNLCGMPCIYLYSGSEGNKAKAFNASELESVGTGLDAYNALTSVPEGVVFKEDGADFSLEGLETGSTGKPLLSAVKEQYKKLVIADKWKTTAMTGDREGPSGDEMIWLVQTREGAVVKFMVTAFPAKGGATDTGYINVIWDLLD